LKVVLFVGTALVFTIFVAFFCGEKFLPASMKSLTNPKVFLVTLFGKPVPALRHPAVIEKVVPKAACDLENCSELGKIYLR
jgi:hypothetical protein